MDRNVWVSPRFRIGKDVCLCPEMDQHSSSPHFGIELPFFSINRKRGMEYPVKSSSPLCVELLEDRCVPAVPPPTTFVIDPALINPNSPPVQMAPPADITMPVIIYMPIAGPFMP